MADEDCERSRSLDDDVCCRRRGGGRTEHASGEGHEERRFDETVARRSISIGDGGKR